MSDVMDRFACGLLCATFALAGCKEKPEPTLAPTASALQAAPVAAGAVTFVVESPSSKVRFLMDSPLEKIDGDASGGLSGALSVDLADISKSTGLVKLDLLKLVLYQQKRDDEKSGYSERMKSDLQNEHARNWLQVTAHEGDVTPEQAEGYRWVEFKVDKLEGATLTNLITATGAERKLSATASGEFRLHGRKQPKSAKLEITVDYQGDKAVALHVKTAEPLAIGLDEFEVQPRDNAGKFVKSLTDALSSNLKGKVASSAPISLEFTAKAQ